MSMIAVPPSAEAFRSEDRGFSFGFSCGKSPFFDLPEPLPDLRFGLAPASSDRSRPLARSASVSAWRASSPGARPFGSEVQRSTASNHGEEEHANPAREEQDEVNSYDGALQVEGIDGGSGGGDGGASYVNDVPASVSAAPRVGSGAFVVAAAAEPAADPPGGTVAEVAHTRPDRRLGRRERRRRRRRDGGGGNGGGGDGGGEGSGGVAGVVRGGGIGGQCHHSDRVSWWRTKKMS